VPVGPSGKPLAFSALNDLFVTLQGNSFRRWRNRDGAPWTLRCCANPRQLVFQRPIVCGRSRPSADVLEFCARRLQPEPVTILLTFRDDSEVFLARPGPRLPLDRVGRVRLGSLTSSCGQGIEGGLRTVVR
jgi:hypothetical protein